jgi:hypothetical protein
MAELGKWLIGVGAVLVGAGVVFVGLGRVHFPLGKLPGDFVYRGKHTTVYFPLATCVLLSLVLTLVIWVVGRWRR